MGNIINNSSLSKVIADLKSSNAELQESNNELWSELEGLEANNLSLASKVSSLTTENENLKSSITTSEIKVWNGTIDSISGSIPLTFLVNLGYLNSPVSIYYSIKKSFGLIITVIASDNSPTMKVNFNYNSSKTSSSVELKAGYSNAKVTKLKIDTNTYDDMYLQYTGGTGTTNKIDIVYQIFDDLTLI